MKKTKQSEFVFLVQSKRVKLIILSLNSSIFQFFNSSITDLELFSLKIQNPCWKKILNTLLNTLYNVQEWVPFVMNSEKRIRIINSKNEYQYVKLKNMSYTNTNTSQSNNIIYQLIFVLLFKRPTWRLDLGTNFKSLLRRLVLHFFIKKT